MSAALPGDNTKLKGTGMQLQHKVRDRYDIVRQLGEGGMGIVYEAYDTQLDRPVALKVLAPELSHNAEATQIFEAEARIMARVRHPHLVSVYDVLRDDTNKRTCLVMEYIEGQTLEDRIFSDRRFFDLEDGISLSLQLLTALTYLHDRGIVHRDIKPANIMLETDGSLRVMDFGLARNLRELIQKGTRVRGTPAYMAPEQVMGRELSTRTDLYAAGVTLFEMFAGELPFRGDDLAYHHIHTPAPDVRARRPDVPVVVALLISACLQKDPAMRPDSALAIMQDMVAGLELHDRPWPAAVISALNMRPSLSHSAMLPHPTGDVAPYDSREAIARSTRDAPRATHQHPLPGAAVHHSLISAAPSPHVGDHEHRSSLQPLPRDTHARSQLALQITAAPWAVPLTLTTLAVVIGLIALQLSGPVPSDTPAPTPQAAHAATQATTSSPPTQPPGPHVEPKEVAERRSPPERPSESEAGQEDEIAQHNTTPTNPTLDFAAQATAQARDAHEHTSPNDTTAPSADDDVKTPAQGRDTTRAARQRRRRPSRRARAADSLSQITRGAPSSQVNPTDEGIHAENNPGAPRDMIAPTTPIAAQGPPDALPAKTAETPQTSEKPEPDEHDADKPPRATVNTEGPSSIETPPAPETSQPARPYGF